MILIRYIDLYNSYYDENGEEYNALIHQNLTVPFEIDLNDAISISPHMTRAGKLFRNVSLIEDRYGKTHKVVGNYKKLIELRDNPPRKTIGYGKTTN
jgi:hypothetical protein